MSDRELVEKMVEFLQQEGFDPTSFGVYGPIKMASLLNGFVDDAIDEASQMEGESYE